MAQFIYSKSISLIFGFFFLISFHLAWSQEPPKMLQKDTIKVVEPILLSNIGTETENTLNIVRDIKSKMNPSKADIELDSVIPNKLKIYIQQREEFDLDEIEYMDLKQSESLKNDFSLNRGQLDGWRTIYMDKTVEINKMKEQLVDLKTRWEKTQNLDGNENLPAQVTERIKTNLKDINDLDKMLTERNNAFLTRQDELTEVLIFVDDVLNSISKTEDSYRNKIFSISSPPIWKMFGSVTKHSSLKDKVIKIVKKHNEGLKIFKQNNRENIFIHLLLFVFLLFLFYFLKADVSQWSDDKKDEIVKNSLYVISKPISSSLIIALLLSKLIYPNAPSDVLIYFNILLAFPILTLLPGLINKVEKKYFFIVGGVIIISQAGNYFSDLVVIERTTFLFLDILTIALLVSLIGKREELKDANPRVNWIFIFTIVRLSLFLLSLSILSNIIGSMILARVLSRGTLLMIYGGAIIYACAIILRSLFALLLQHNAIASLNIIQNYAIEVKKQTYKIIRWSTILYWLYITFTGYLIYEPIYKWIADFLAYEWNIGSIAVSIGSFLAFFITLWISLLFAKFTRFILQDEILTHFDLPRGVPGTISTLVRLSLICIGFILAFGAAKIDMSNIAIVFGALGVGIGFGLQNIFNNLVSGLIIAFERPLQVGDVIQIATLDLMGEVKDIGIRASTIRTFDGAEVIVPNGNLVSNEMINWTLSDHRRRQEILVGVAYGSDTKKVLAILNEVVSKQGHILKNPSPSIIFIGFGESSLDFRVLFWTHFEDGLVTKSEVGMAIDEAFKESGIEIPFPQRDLHIKRNEEQSEFNDKPAKKVKELKPEVKQVVNKPKNSKN